MWVHQYCKARTGLEWLLVITIHALVNSCQVGIVLNMRLMLPVLVVLLPFNQRCLVIVKVTDCFLPFLSASRKRVPWTSGTCYTLRRHVREKCKLKRDLSLLSVELEIFHSCLSSYKLFRTVCLRLEIFHNVCPGRCFSQRSFELEIFTVLCLGKSFSQLPIATYLSQPSVQVQTFTAV